MNPIRARAVLSEIAIDLTVIGGSTDYSDSTVTHFHYYVSKYYELYERSIVMNKLHY